MRQSARPAPGASGPKSAPAAMTITPRRLLKSLLANSGIHLRELPQKAMTANLHYSRTGDFAHRQSQRGLTHIARFYKNRAFRRLTSFFEKSRNSTIVKMLRFSSRCLRLTTNPASAERGDKRMNHAQKSK